MKNFFHTRTASLLAGAFSLLSMLPVAAQTDPANPPEGWVQVGQPIRMTSKVPGSRDLGAGTVPRRHMEMTLDLVLTIYKTQRPVNNQDYYLVEARQNHAVRGYASNWISVGYYGKEMSLAISGNGAYLYEHGPNSTVGTNTSGFTVGASIGFEGKQATGSASGAYSRTYSAPAVTVESRAMNDMLSLKTKLPADLGDPKEPSRSGYTSTGVAIYQVPTGHGLQLTVASTALWQYEYTRLIVNDRVSAMNTGTFWVDFQGKQIVHSSNLCMAAQGPNVVLEQCQTYGGDWQRWSVTPQGQIMNVATRSCLDRSSDNGSASNLTLTNCANQAMSQQYSVGSGGCMANALYGCSQTMLPGIYTMGTDPSRAGWPLGVQQPQAGARVRVLDPLSSQILTFWRVQ